MLIIIVPVVPVAAVSVAIIGVDVGCDGAIVGTEATPPRSSPMIGPGCLYFHIRNATNPQTMITSGVRQPGA